MTVNFAGIESNEELYSALKEVVVEGAKLLDSEKPGWIQEICEEDLNLRSPHNCILGQVYGGYSDGASTLTQGRFWKWEYWQRSEWGMSHGFYLTEHLHEYYPLLTEYWKLYIQEHRN